MVSDVRILVIRTKILNTINYSILIILSCLFETRTWSAYTQNQTPDGRTAAISNAANCGEAFVVLVLCLWRRRLKLKWNLFLKLKYHRRQECEWRFFTASTGLVYTGLYISHKVWQSWTCIGWGLHVWLAVVTRSSADADNRLDAFSGQLRSTNMETWYHSTCNI